MTPILRGLADPVRSKTEAALDIAIAHLNLIASGSVPKADICLCAQTALDKIAELRK